MNKIKRISLPMKYECIVICLVLVISKSQANSQDFCDESHNVKNSFINSSHLWKIEGCGSDTAPLFIPNEFTNLNWAMEGIVQFYHDVYSYRDDDYTYNYLINMEAIKPFSDKNGTIAKINFKAQLLDIHNQTIRIISDDNYIPTNSSIKFNIGGLNEYECNVSSKLLVDLNVLVNEESGLSLFVGNEKFSDVTLTIKDRIIYAHKIILSSRSPVFDKLLESNLENKNLNITIDADVDYTTIIEALRYMYTGRVRNINDLNSNLLTVANRYKIDGLKELYENHAYNNMNSLNSISMLNTAVANDAYKLKKFCIQYIADNLYNLANTTDFKSLMVKDPELTTEIIVAALSNK